MSIINSGTGAAPETVTTSTARLAVLDGVRGLAVLIVLASHFSSAGLFPKPALHGVGKSGVYLFFVLSAFLLTRNILRQPPTALRTLALWTDYAVRRVLRIWPLYLFVLLASWWCVRIGFPVLYAIDTGSLWRHLTLREGVSVLWSIPVEFTFYLVLPVVAICLVGMAKVRWPAWAQASACVLALLAVTLAWPPAASIENDVRLWPYLAVFLCGAFAARIDVWLRHATPKPLMWTAVGVVALAAWCVAIPAVWCALRSLPFEATVSRTWYVFFGLLWAGLLLAVMHGGLWLHRLFAWAPLRWVGLISFSLYLWHMPVLQAMQRLDVVDRAPLFAPWLVLAVALAVSWLSWWVFERPFSRVRWTQRPK